MGGELTSGRSLMYVADIELHESTTLAEATALMKRYAPNARLLAGGTDLLVDLKTGRSTVKHLIALSRVTALRGVTLTEEGLRIGALTTVTQLDRSSMVGERFAPILDATRQMASPAIRNVATVGGNIVSAVPCADLPPILIAMNASVRLWSAGQERSVALRSFFSGPRETAMSDDELLTAVIVPEPEPGFGAAYERFGLREGNAIAVAAVAAGLVLDQDNTVRQARLVLGAVAPIPKVVESAGEILVGLPAGDDTFERAARAAQAAAEPISDVRGSAGFRRELIEVLARRALKKACRRAQEHIE